MFTLFMDPDVQARLNDHAILSSVQDYDSKVADASMYSRRVHGGEEEMPVVTWIEHEISKATSNKEALVISDVPERSRSPTPFYQLSYLLTAPARDTSHAVSNTSTINLSWSSTYFYSSGQDPRAVIHPFLRYRQDLTGSLTRLVYALYRQTIEFRGSVKGAIAFLHDHIDLLCIIRRITFRYRLATRIIKHTGDRNCSTVPRASLWDFRRFSNIPVHKMAALTNYKLIVDADFWDMVDWESRTAESIFSQADLCEARKYVDKDSRHRNFLRHFARLTTHCHAKLTILGCDSPEKLAFHERLDQVILAWRQHRSDCVSVRTCVCDIRAQVGNRLDSCCLWNLPWAERRDGFVPTADTKHVEQERQNFSDELNRKSLALRRELASASAKNAHNFLDSRHFRAYCRAIQSARDG